MNPPNAQNSIRQYVQHPRSFHLARVPDTIFNSFSIQMEKNVSEIEEHVRRPH